MTIEEHILAAMECAAARLVGSTVDAGPRAMQRGIADVLENYLTEQIREGLKDLPGTETDPARSKRCLEDFSVRRENWTTWVDVKTKDSGGTFSMPNLVSIQRLWRIFESPTETLVFLFTDYTIVDRSRGMIRIDNILCVPADRMNPEMLHIQNLGLGQLQMRADVRSRDLVASGPHTTLREALPGMAVAFHQHQIEKLQREAETWSRRIDPAVECATGPDLSSAHP